MNNFSTQKGFDEPFCLKELLVLGAFKEKYIAWPTDTGLSDSEIKYVLNQLKKRNIVTGFAPYRLTKKGVRVTRYIAQELLKNKR